MKIKDERPNIESSKGMEEQFFSMQDQGMIFDILRSKMYSNPILAICREISCNARDAHREVGKEDVPIEISLPNSLAPYFKIKDFGPGISPDRMSNVFIKYTASTKRNDNIQTGGFGLGAKTPFSYSDTFSIVTNVDGKQYNYSCFIDETKVGKLALVWEIETAEPNGTEIIIPVKKENFTDFSVYTEQAVRYWKVLPIIKGSKMKLDISEPILSGDKWKIVQSIDYNRRVKAIVDGIEYILNDYNNNNNQIILNCRGDLLLFFDVGELTLSANREQVFLDENTKKLINTRLSYISAEIKRIYTEKIDKMDNLYDANILFTNAFNKAFNNHSFLGLFFWRGVQLKEYTPTTEQVFCFNNQTGNSTKIKRSTKFNLEFSPNSLLVVNDTKIKEPTFIHVKSAFNEDQNLQKIQVLCPKTVDSYETDLKKWNDNLNLNKMKFKLLSTLTNAGNRKKYTNSKLNLFKFNTSFGTFTQTSQAIFNEDKSNKILCKIVCSKNRTTLSLNNSKIMNVSTLALIDKEYTKHSFYAVYDSIPKERIDKSLSSYKNIDDFLNEEFILNKKIDYVALESAVSNIKKLHSMHTDYLRFYPKIKPLILDANSQYLKCFSKITELHDIVDKSNFLRLINYEIGKQITEKEISDFNSKNKEYDLVSLYTSTMAKYSLLDLLNSYNYKQKLKFIAQYINLIDAHGDQYV